MIRKLMLCALCGVSSMMSAQTVTGSFKELASFGKANIEINFSDASIHSMTEEDFAEYEQDWSKDKPGVIADFIDGVTDKLKGGLVVGTRLKTPFLLKVLVQNITTKGDYTCDVVVLNDEKEVAAIKTVKADGGTFGSKLNLIKDGAEHTGEKLGKLLSREIKRAHKK